MKAVSDKEFLVKIPRRLYTKELQKMFDYLRYKKATQGSKASQKSVDVLVEAVRKQRNEKALAAKYL